ncbi:MAG: hypothetical protein PSX36_12945 [bacterium]|nr:hypothetical protein [bacterium]
MNFIRSSKKAGEKVFEPAPMKRKTYQENFPVFLIWACPRLSFFIPFGGVALSVASPRHAKRQAWLWAFHYNRSRSNQVVSI